jgi:hypothetical protein
MRFSATDQRCAPLDASSARKMTSRGVTPPWKSAT